MRLVGMALLAAWLLAWAASPHGEPMRQASIVGAVAVAGGEDAALAWLELRHGSASEPGILHVATLDDEDRVTLRMQIPVGPDAVSFRIVDAGDGLFVLVSEFRGEAGRWFDFRRFMGEETRKSFAQAGTVTASRWPSAWPQLVTAPITPVQATLDDGPWQVSAAGDELM